MARTPEQAREAVRGTTALVDGMRCVYALWPVVKNEASKICQRLGVKYQPNFVVKGAVVKANGPSDRSVRTLLRDQNGVLNDITEELKLAMPNREEALEELLGAIRDAAERGHPYTKTGKSGVYQRRSDLPERFRDMGRDRLEGLVQELLVNRDLVLCSAAGSGTRASQWLDVSNGPFARGEGHFVPGASHPTVRRDRS